MARTALLICDFQKGLLALWPDGAHKARVQANLSQLLSKVRASEMYEKGDILVIFVGLAFEPGYPDINAGSHALLRHFKCTQTMQLGTDDVRFFPKPSGHGAELIIYKKRGSAFHDTQLDTILRDRDVRKLAIAGLATSGVVLSTARQAFDLDYEVFVLNDVCGDPDDELHQLIMSRVLPAHTTVTTFERWISSL